MSLEDVRKELDIESQNDIERAGKEYVNSVKDLNSVTDKVVDDEMSFDDSNYSSSDAGVVKKSAEALDAPGYGSSDELVQSKRHDMTNSISGSTGVNGNRSNNSSNNTLPKNSGLGEQAPDIGKDYGSAPPPTNNGVNSNNDYPNYNRQVSSDNGKNQNRGEDGKRQNGGSANDLDNKKASSSENAEGGQTKKDNSSDGSSNKSQNNQSQKDNSTSKNSKGESNQNNGNGYGALNNNNRMNSATDMSDPTARARRNFERNNKSKESDNSSSPKTNGSKTSTKSGGSSIKNAINKAGAGIKNAASKFRGKKDDPKGASKGSDVTDKALGNAKNLIFSFLMKHPISIVAIAVILLILIIMLFDAMDGANNRGRGKRSCTYQLNGVTSTGTVELSNLKVELINCDGKADNYEVLDTVDFEKYILGVALAEAGPSSPDEALKAQMIAVRNFTLTRNSGMCPSNPSDCFHGYNESSGIIRMRACTNDQVYWDYTKDCPKIDRAGKPTLYCEGVDGSTDIWKRALSQERQKEVEALANEVMGEVLLDENGNVMKLGYMAAETQQFISDAQAGKSYVEILEAVYGSSSYSSAKCSYGGVYDYGDYTLSSENTNILHEPLDEFLEDNGTSLEEFNKLIADNVDDAGWGTRAGVVAAAVTLIGELGDNYGVKVPYYWGGGHYDGVVDGALGYWGSTQCHTYANNQHYNYCGFDCSGFVPWAIKNGGFKKSQDLAGNFQNMPNARKVSLRNEPVLQPGDLLESSGHIILVVGIDEASGQYICAEAMGNSYGVLFSRRSFTESGYWGVDLEDYYNNPNNIREPIR